MASESETTDWTTTIAKEYFVYFKTKNGKYFKKKGSDGANLFVLQDEEPSLVKITYDGSKYEEHHFVGDKWVLTGFSEDGMTSLQIIDGEPLTMTFTGYECYFNYCVVDIINDDDQCVFRLAFKYTMSDLVYVEFANLKPTLK